MIEDKARAAVGVAAEPARTAPESQVPDHATIARFRVRHEWAPVDPARRVARPRQQA
jgi:hypothetical protein